MRFLFKALTGAVSTDTVPPAPGPALSFDIPRACTIYAQFSWTLPGPFALANIDTIVAFEVSIDGVNYFQLGPNLEFNSGSPGVVNGIIAPAVITPGCKHMRMNLIHFNNVGATLNVTWTVFDNNGLT